MRCVCCNKNLNDWESTARHAETGEFLDTCRHCLDSLEIPIHGRADLSPDEDMDEELDDVSSDFDDDEQV